MTTSDSVRERLRSIQTFPSLVMYLRDELEWPIETEDFDDLTFDYEPEELGLDPETATKIDSIKQLRPLESTQPWGIFFVEFEPKHLPVVVLRRILRSLVIKKRQSANRSEQATWYSSDLLFISTYGVGTERQINFAHFAESPMAGDLPMLRVLGWDNADTPLHLDHVHHELHEKLLWPDTGTDKEMWRASWASAFTLRHREIITTSKQLAVRLAELARVIRQRTNAVLAVESEKGPIRSLMAAFRESLIHDLEEDDFADMYAQTIAYGLLTARVSRPSGLVAENVSDMVPITNPFLKELLQTFLTLGGRKSLIDFDELGINDVVEMLRNANMEAVLRDFGDRNPQEDPAIHFYELFLNEYDKKKKMQRGVFYTPLPVVAFIVRSVDEILRTEFGLKDGLADTTTWGEMIKRHPGMQLPEQAPENSPFVQILDPATGTGTFIVEVIDLIYKTMITKWKAEGYMPLEFERLWNEYVPNHLLPRLYGFELMMAPYAIAHMKIGLKLYETGYRFRSDQRTQVFLSNSLEPAQDLSGMFEQMAPALAREAHAANKIKAEVLSTIIIGNPPYSVTSANMNSFIDDLMSLYKHAVRGEKGLVALADDYLKFLRFSQFVLSQVPIRIHGMITNRGYLKGIIHRGAREALLNDFQQIRIVDLHGDSNIGERPPVGYANENVFDIQQGVAIGLFSRPPNSNIKSQTVHCEIWGTRDEKYNWLSQTNLNCVRWAVLSPRSPWYFFVPFDDSLTSEYESFMPVNDLLPINSCGVKTHRDALVIDISKNALIERMTDIATEKDLSVIEKRYSISDTVHWSLKHAKKFIMANEIESCIKPITYRPFDDRWIYYNPKIIEKGDSKYPTLRHLMQPNIGLLTSRIQAKDVFNAVFISRSLVEMKTAESTRSSTVFPLFSFPDESSAQFGLSMKRHTNLNPAWIQRVAELTLLEPVEEIHGDLLTTFGAQDVLHYIYAILHSPSGRKRYGEQMRVDFPRIPTPMNANLFLDLCQLGADLVALHLLDNDYEAASWKRSKGANIPLKKQMTTFVDKGGTEIGTNQPKYITGKVYINNASHFDGVSEAVWDFSIGGYQVCHKWLKDRRGRVLSEEDITHYQKIVVALNETGRMMNEIDEVIKEHGGWPGAFATVSLKDA